MNNLRAYWNFTTIYFSRSSETWINIIFPGLFTFLFLLYFQPFGVNNYDPSEKISPPFFFSMFAMGATVSLGLTINEFLIRKRLIKSPFTHWQRIVWVLWTLIFISTLVFLLYNLFGNWHDFYWSSYLQFIGNICAMAVLPLGMMFVYFQFKKLKQDAAKEKGNHPSRHADSLLRFCSDNGKDMLTVSEENLVFIESQDNYAAIYYETPQGLQKHLIRSSLKNLESGLKDTSVIRCHRSFLVNMKQILSCKGNKHGLSLGLKKLDRKIPVSRNYVTEIEAILHTFATSRVIHP